MSSYAKVQCEHVFDLSHILKIMVPSVTLDIMKFKKMQEPLRNTGTKNLLGAKRDKHEYKMKCVDATFFPFSLATEEKNLEFVAMD